MKQKKNIRTAELYGLSMTISPMSVRFGEHTMWVELSDARTLGVPLAWFPHLLNATPAQRDKVELSRLGLHWEELNDDISVDGLLAGHRDQIARSDEVAGILTTKERFEGWLALAQLRRDRAKYRNANEWKIAFSIWGLLVGLIYYEWTQVDTGPLMAMSVATIILVLHTTTLVRIWRGMKTDMEIAFRYIRKAEEMLAHPGEELTVVDSSRAESSWKEIRQLVSDYSVLFQFVATLVLSIGYLSAVQYGSS